MALADHFQRSALAVAQVVTGFDEAAFRAAIETPVGISVDARSAATAEGAALVDLTIRLLARLYPTLAVQAPPDAQAVSSRMVDLARAINPRIDIVADAELGIVIGEQGPTFDRSIFAGSSAWSASLSLHTPQAVGDSAIPFGAGAAACLAAAWLFRLGPLGQIIDNDELTFTCVDDAVTIGDPPGAGWPVPSRSALVGAGAIGQAAVWALARTPLTGELHLVDPEPVELSNLQRYVLTGRADVDELKVDLAASFLRGGVTPRPHHGPWSSFVQAHGYTWDAVLSALDSAADRRAVQASLPAWIVNAWTQPGDLGVSDHRFGVGACVACLYLPSGSRPNEDELIAAALAVPDRLLEVRAALYNGAPPSPELLDAIATGLSVERHHLEPFAESPIRRLYVQGVCGGDIVPLAQIGAPTRELHVPLAHQSALAGVLLAARFTRHAAGLRSPITESLRVDVMRDVTPAAPTPMAPDPRGICLCQDDDYIDAYREKWG